MKLYRIVTHSQIFNVELEFLSRNLTFDCEIYDVSDGEIFLGAINHKSYVYIASEIADYCINNYYKDDNPLFQEALTLTRRWLEDTTSVSVEENTSIQMLIRKSCDSKKNNNVLMIARRMLNCILERNGGSAAEIYFISHYVSDSFSLLTSKEEEFIRQGHFVLDFLKSDKHLFIGKL
jgi:hypothetical protein